LANRAAESIGYEEYGATLARTRIVFKQLGGTDFVYCASQGGNLFLDQIVT